MSWGLVAAATVLALAGGYQYGQWWQDRGKRRELHLALACFALSLFLLVGFWVTVWA